MTVKRPAKPTRNFPLWAHKSGSWVAIVEGERKSFGGWRRDPDGEHALARFEAYTRGLAKPVNDDTVILKDVANLYITRQLRRAEAGEIGWRQFRDLKTSIEDFASTVGRSVRVADLRPNRFTAYRDSLVARGYVASTVKRTIANIKAMFRWAYDQERINAPPRYGGEFKPVRSTKPPRKLLFSADEIAMMITAAKLPLRAMIRLGVECGFGNTDIAALLWEQVDLDNRVIALHRHKTKIERRCIISNELAQDLRDWRELRAKWKGSNPTPDRVFVTKRGCVYVREVPSDDPKAPPRVVDSVGILFDKHIRNKVKIKAKKDGRSFYTLRRTHRTWADELRDPHAAALVMGHKFQSVAGLYVQHVGDERLSAINSHIVNRIKQTQSRLQSEAKTPVVVSKRREGGSKASLGKRRARAAQSATSSDRHQRSR